MRPEVRALLVEGPLPDGDVSKDRGTGRRVGRLNAVPGRVWAKTAASAG
ncbi:hypothetical protein [Streptomyces europaeiscabiei]|nr:hypothetical protein OHB30_21875 [Streptomyces europaeiscabiei]